MAAVIIDVIQVLPATDWFFGNTFDEKPLKQYEPVVVFAVVATMAPEYANLGQEKRTIPLGMDHYRDLSNLIGGNPDEFDTDIVYKTQIL